MPRARLRIGPSTGSFRNRRRSGEFGGPKICLTQPSRSVTRHLSRPWFGSRQSNASAATSASLPSGSGWLLVTIAAVRTREFLVRTTAFGGYHLTRLSSRLQGAHLPFGGTG